MKALVAIGEFITGHSMLFVLFVACWLVQRLVGGASGVVWEAKYALADKDWTDQKAAQDWRTSPTRHKP